MYTHTLVYMYTNIKNVRRELNGSGIQKVQAMIIQLELNMNIK